jgi:hypothetical protein
MELEDLRTEVEAISASVTKLRNGGITENALAVLIQHASPSITTGSMCRTTKPSMKMIHAVMDGMEDLEAYVFGEEEEEEEEEEDG